MSSELVCALMPALLCDSYVDDRYTVTTTFMKAHPDPNKRFESELHICFPFTHQRPLQLEDGGSSEPVLWGHLPPPAPSTKRIRWTLLLVELPSNQRREFPSLRVPLVPLLWAKYFNKQVAQTWFLLMKLWVIIYCEIKIHLDISLH